jgi:hypothetical protein
VADIGAPLSITLPQVQVTLGPEWANDLNTALQTIIDAVEAGVRTAVGLLVDADVAFNAFSATSIGTLVFTNQSGAIATTLALYYRDGDLWANDVDGNQIQITAAGTLNAAALGGIVGDYGGSNPAKVTYVEAASTYVFTQDPNVPAKVDVGDIKLRKAGETSPNAITIAAPAALAGAYSFTMPAALPVGPYDSVVKISNAGVLAASDSTVMVLPGLSIDAPAVLHDIAVLSIPASMMSSKTTTGWLATDTSSLFNWQHATAAVEALTCPIPILVGDAVGSVTLYCQQGAATLNLLVCQLVDLNMSTGSITTRSDAVGSGAINGTLTIVLTGISGATLAAGHVLLLKITTASSTTNKIVYAAEVGYARS